MTASEINEQLFMSFVAGWFVGIVVGAVFGGYHWPDLQSQLGRLLIFSVSSALGTTLLLSMRAARKIAAEFERVRCICS